MTEKRFIVDGDMVRDIEGKIPTILTYNKKQLNEFLDGLNELNDENKQLKSELKALRKKYNDFSDMVDKRLKEMDMGLVK